MPKKKTSPDLPCDYNLKNNPPGKFFGGTVDDPKNLATSLMNNELNTPMSIEYGDGISVFLTWLGYGPAAGFVLFPCAAEQVSVLLDVCSWL